MRISDIKNRKRGPINIYQDSGERDEKTGQLVQEEYLDDRGAPHNRPKREVVLKDLYYRPNMMTPKMEDEIKKIEEEFKDRQVHRAAHAVARLVVEWDLTDDNDKMIPLTYDEIIKHDIPAELLYAVIIGIAEDQRPPKASTETSGSIS